MMLATPTIVATITVMIIIMSTITVITIINLRAKRDRE